MKFESKLGKWIMAQKRKRPMKNKGLRDRLVDKTIDKKEVILEGKENGPINSNIRSRFEVLADMNKEGAQSAKKINALYECTSNGYKKENLAKRPVEAREKRMESLIDGLLFGFPTRPILRNVSRTSKALSLKGCKEIDLKAGRVAEKDLPEGEDLGIIVQIHDQGEMNTLRTHLVCILP